MNIDKRRKHILGDQRYGFGTVSFSWLMFFENCDHIEPPSMGLTFEENCDHIEPPSMGLEFTEECES